MRVLVVEDDEKIGSFVARGLEQESHAVDWVKSGERGLELLTSEHYDAAVLDVMLPGRDGLSVLRAARTRKVHTPIIVLSAKGQVEDRVDGLHAGADDYMTKPFSFAELLARLQALMRRGANAVSAATVLTYDDVAMDLRTRRVTRAGREITLQAKEFALLEYLLRNAERVVSKTMILEHVWDYSFDPQTNVVDVLVCRLRARLDRDFDTRLIHTLRGVGYVLRRE